MFKLRGMKNSIMIRLARLLPDKMYLSLKFYKYFGRFPNWKDPKTYNEKLQWLKLHDRNPEYTMMVDKYAVKEYVSGIIGEEYVIPTLGVWDRPEDIEWDKLPNQFVLKTTNGGGNEGVVICCDKAHLDKRRAVSVLNESLGIDLYNVCREWPYKNVIPRIIVEKYMEDPSTKELIDYKFYCFNGIPKFVMVASGRLKNNKVFAYFDEKWNKLDFRWGAPKPDKYPQKPENFEKMLELSSKLSADLPHVRVDLYNVDGQIYFGELTFYDGSGMERFEPEEWDYKFGEWLKLPIGK